jgi:hypothetical protein
MTPGELQVVDCIALHANTAMSYLMVCQLFPLWDNRIPVRQHSGFIWDGKCRSAEVTWLWGELAAESCCYFVARFHSNTRDVC